MMMNKKVLAWIGVLGMVLTSIAAGMLWTPLGVLMAGTWCLLSCKAGFDIHKEMSKKNGGGNDN